jgi:hypothetical protein
LAGSNDSLVFLDELLKVDLHRLQVVPEDQLQHERPEAEFLNPF